MHNTYYNYCMQDRLKYFYLLLSFPSRTSVAFGGRDGNGISASKNNFICITNQGFFIKLTFRRLKTMDYCNYVANIEKPKP